MKHYGVICLILLGLVIFPVAAQTTVQKTEDSWQLIVDGNPYEVKGVTFGYDDDAAVYDDYFKELQSLGVNTIRTWATGENTPQLLDAARRHQIKVLVGIWMRHGRPGMEDDDRFDYLNDWEGKKDMYDNALQVVAQYKDHPAVLAWGIGNEVYLNMATDAEKKVYSALLEKICSEIKARDPNHPIVSVEAWTFGMDWWSTYVPSVDIYGLNCYGYGAALLQEEMEKKGIDKPYLITEFGVTGEWDIKDKINGVTVEPSDAQKYEAIVTGYKDWILPKSKNLGVFVFHYASEQNFMAPWLFTHVNGMTRPQYWAIREAYTGQKPLNTVPEIARFEIAESTADSGNWIPVKLQASDQESDSLQISFYYNQRSGSRKRRDQLIPLEFRGSLTAGFEIKAPPVDGPVKIYAYVADSYNNLGIASTGIQVKDEAARNRKYLVPRPALPFYVYQDGDKDPYTASAYMGAHEAMTVDTQHPVDPKMGNACLKIKFYNGQSWYGLGLVDPANDWGDILGGYDLSGATTFSFWAKASQKKVKATIGFGLIEGDKPYPDTAKKSMEIKLTTQWKKYSIPLKGLDLSCIRSGFTLFSSNYGLGQDIYIDDIVFE